MLALTTTQAFWIIDQDTGEAWQIDCGKGVYYGLTFTTKRLYVACRQAAYGAERAVQENIVLVYDTELKLERVLVPKLSPIRDVHQIFASGDKLFVVSTFDDCILEYDMVNERWSQWFPFLTSMDENVPRNQYHINSIFAYDGTIYLAGNKSGGGWVASFLDGDQRSLSSRIELGKGTHNVWLEKGHIHVCSSNSGSIIDQSGTEYLVRSDAFLRGICNLGSRLFAGASQDLSRSDRAFSNCRILELSDKNTIVNALVLQGYGMAHDLRSLNVEDPVTHNGQCFLVNRDLLDERFVKSSLVEELASFSTKSKWRLLRRRA